MIEPEAAPGAAPQPPATSSPFAAVPLSPRAVVTASFELLAAAQRPLRSASFYAGWLALATMLPLVLLVASLGSLDSSVFDGVLGVRATALDGPLSLAFVLATLGYVVVVIDSRAIAAALVGASLEGRPVTLAGAVRLAQRRFWRLVAVAIVAGIPTVLGQTLASGLAQALVGDVAQATIVAGVAGGIVAGSPFAYALAGVVLGEVAAFEALRRSVRLARVRPRLALTVAGFGVLSQLLLLLALSAGLDLVFRVGDVVALPAGRAADVLPVAVGAVLVFGLGTLLFTAEALATAPQVHAFVALTHYARGLELARTVPPTSRPWQPWIGRALAVAILLGVYAAVTGLDAIRHL